MSDLPVSDIYVDESSQTKHRFLVLGGLIIPHAELNAFCEAIEAARQPELPANSVKWGRVSRTKLDAYKRLVDVFFDPSASAIHFHSLVVDTHQQNHPRWNKGSREIGFQKEVYQLAQKFRRLYPNPVFHLYPHQRSTPQATEELRDILNHGARKKGDGRDWPFRRVHFRALSGCLPLQVVDTLLGALAYRLNGHYDERGASAARKELCDHILRQARIGDVTRDTRMTGKMTIWHRQLRGVPSA